MDTKDIALEMTTHDEKKEIIVRLKTYTCLSRMISNRIHQD